MTHFIAHHGYLAVFVLMLLESACIPIPSEAILLLGGALATNAVAHDKLHVTALNWVVVAIVGIVGNLAGSLIAYAVGRFGGRSLIEHRALSWLIRPHHLEKADEFFARRGRVAVGVGRILPVVRTFISLPAGIAEMPVVPFVAYTVAGCVPWIFAFTAIGVGVGSKYDTIAHDFTPVSIVFGLLVVAGVVTWWLRNRGTAAENAADEARLYDKAGS